MILGRYIGTLVGINIALLFHTGSYWGDFLLAFIFAAIGTILGMLVSTYLGINFNTDQPTEKDGLKYWTDKYGDEFGKEAYAEWLKTLK